MRTTSIGTSRVAPRRHIGERRRMSLRSLAPNRRVLRIAIAAIEIKSVKSQNDRWTHHFQTVEDGLGEVTENRNPR